MKAMFKLSYKHRYNVIQQTNMLVM